MGSYESDKKNMRFVGLKFSRTTDADILARLDAQDNIQGYIKSLIRADIDDQTLRQAHRRADPG